MRSRGHKEILPPGGGYKALETVVVVVDSVFLYKIGGSLVSAHCGEEICRRDEHHELELRLVAAIGNVHPVEPGAVHSDVRWSALRGARRTMERREVAHSAFAFKSTDSRRIVKGVIAALEVCSEKGW